MSTSRCTAPLLQPPDRMRALGSALKLPGCSIEAVANLRTLEIIMLTFSSDNSAKWVSPTRPAYAQRCIRTPGNNVPINLPCGGVP